MAQRISKFWLRVAKKVLEMGDGATAATISWMLNASYLDRLAYDGIHLIENYDEDFKELSVLFNPARSFKAYREYDNLKVPCIAILKKDLIYMREIECNFGAGGLPPLVYLVGQKVEEIREYQENLKRIRFRDGGDEYKSSFSVGRFVFKKKRSKKRSII